jgi:hypothetical protein
MKNRTGSASNGIGRGRLAHKAGDCAFQNLFTIFVQANQTRTRPISQLLCLSKPIENEFFKQTANQVNTPPRLALPSQKRHQSDKTVNNREVEVFRDGKWVLVNWEDVKVCGQGRGVGCLGCLCTFLWQGGGGHVSLRTPAAVLHRAKRLLCFLTCVAL